MATTQDQRIDEMDTTAFMAIIDAFIDRESQDCGELPAAVFYDALENMFQKPGKVVQTDTSEDILVYSGI